MVALALLLLAPALSFAAEPPRVLLRTQAGDLVIALDRESAPKHVERFLELAAAGAYDGVPLVRVDWTRWAHFGGVSLRPAPLSPAAEKALRALPTEPGRRPHLYGSVTLARDRENPDPFGTSFAILVAAIPPMDGVFTRIGEVEQGRELLEAWRELAVDGGFRPLRPVAIDSLRPLAAGERPALRPLAREALGLDSRAAARRRARAVGLAAGAAALLFWAFRRRRDAWASAALLALLGAYFLVFFGELAGGAAAKGGGLVLLLAGWGVFRLMAGFEGSAAAREPAARS